MEPSRWFTPPAAPSNWFAPPATLEPPRKRERSPFLPTHKEGKALMLVQFEAMLPRILEDVCSGATINKAIGNLRPVVNIDCGAFLRWLKKNPEYYSMYKEAIEIRAEVWTGRYLQHAEGVDENGEATANDVSRDKLAMDAYKWLISTQNRKEYGDVKQLQIDQQISIVGALDAARARTRAIIEAEVVDVDLLDDFQPRQLLAPRDDSEEDDE